MDFWVETQASFWRRRAFGEEKNPTFINFFGNNNLKNTSSTTILGIIIGRLLRWTKHISDLVKKVDEILALLSKTLVSCFQAVYLKLYTSMVHPHLELASLAWNIYLARHPDLLETVQKRATKRILTVHLASLGMITSKLRCLVDARKIIRHLSKNNLGHIFEFRMINTRGHATKIRILKTI